MLSDADCLSVSTVSFNCLVRSNRCLDIKNDILPIFSFYVSVQVFSINDNSFSIDYTFVEVGKSDLRNVEILRVVLASINKSLESFKNGVSGHNEIRDIILLELSL